MKIFLSRNETGRSMVEMLGVLAVMGVLSVGAIYGYQIAMRRYRANEIAQSVSILYTMAKSADAGEGECMKLSSTSMETKIAGVDVDIMVDATLDPAKIFVKIADGDLCTAVENLFPDDDSYSLECSDEDLDCNA